MILRNLLKPMMNGYPLAREYEIDVLFQVKLHLTIAYILCYQFSENLGVYEDDLQESCIMF